MTETPIAIDRDDNRQADRRFRRRHNEHEGGEGIAIQQQVGAGFAVAPKGDQVDIDRVKHQLHGHQHSYRVAPRQDAKDAN